jgi:hypothetical protein
VTECAESQVKARPGGAWVLLFHLVQGTMMQRDSPLLC